MNNHFSGKYKQHNYHLDTSCGLPTTGATGIKSTMLGDVSTANHQLRVDKNKDILHGVLEDASSILPEVMRREWVKDV